MVEGLTNYKSNPTTCYAEFVKEGKCVRKGTAWNGRNIRIGSSPLKYHRTSFEEVKSVDVQRHPIS